MLAQLDGAATAFQRALDQLGLQDSVITFIASDLVARCAAMSEVRTMPGVGIA